MEKILELYNRYRDYILFFLSFLIIISCNLLLYCVFKNDINSLKEKFNNREVTLKKDSLNEVNYIVDIKGEVKKPGVYSLNKDDRVIDVVKKAGGFTKYADSRPNNLSKKIKDEMVIIIYSRDEVNDYLLTVKDEDKINEMCLTNKFNNDSCIDKDSSGENDNTTENNNSNVSSNNKDDKDDNKKISINTASKDELTSITGIGDSKADAIIEYRKDNKFETIEDIKKVSGIGDALFEKIKDYITT